MEFEIDVLKYILKTGVKRLEMKKREQQNKSSAVGKLIFLGMQSTKICRNCS